MRPYFSKGKVRIYHGDCVHVLHHLAGMAKGRCVSGLSSFDALVTDPPWPGAAVKWDSPEQTLRNALSAASPIVQERFVIQLGCDTDPRLLDAVSLNRPFLRACWLRYAQPGYKGRLLNSGDVAYVFGIPPAPNAKRSLMPGECTSTESSPRGIDHPCPRRLQHVRWLVDHFGGKSIIDPFMGSGTTILAAYQLGLRALGIEREERYCELAAQRLAQGQFDFSSV